MKSKWYLCIAFNIGWLLGILEGLTSSHLTQIVIGLAASIGYLITLWNLNAKEAARCNGCLIQSIPKT